MEKNRAAFTQHLASIVQKMIEVYDLKNCLPYQRLDNEFHYSFFAHCGNSLISKAYDLFSPRICALRTQLSTPQPYLLSRSFEEHKMLLAFVQDGDVVSAMMMLKEHINRTRECHSRLLTETKAASGHT
jgi:DNA-binding GntR family transcriptional regulator